ncbi:glycosyltransferase family 4 protein [bacterium]|nr:glycosyltransferase family 4 protein [bacterium]
MKKVLFFTKYTRMGANSRYRSYQYVTYIKKNGIDVDIAPLFDDKYIEYIYSRKKLFIGDIFRCYFRRFIKLFSLKKYDLIIIEAELFPYIPNIFEWLLKVFKISYILDYDDAIFHHYDEGFLKKILLGRKIGNIAKNAKAIITGSPYLTNYMNRYNKKIYEIPTVIDLNKYPVEKAAMPKIFTIGWIGSPYTEDYLLEIYAPLKEFYKGHNYKLVLIGASQKMVEKLKDLPIEIVEWNEGDEVGHLQKFNVGIMPLPDTKWTRGKCGFKLIQYMGCFLPVIADPVGINKKLVKEGITGFLPREKKDWISVLEKIYKNEKLQIALGNEGRQIIEKKYSIEVVHKNYLNILSNIVNKKF